MVNLKLQKDFELLRDHCISIRRDYNTYNALFFSGSHDLLTKSAPMFFNDLAEIMRRDWLLQVCKLMDPAVTKQRGKVLENISIKLIDAQLKDDRLMSKKISILSKSLLEYGKKIIPARHKLIAHADRHHQINDIRLGFTTDKELVDVLYYSQKYCDEVGIVIGVGPLDINCGSYSGDVSDLLSILEEYFSLPKQRWEKE